MLLLSTTPSLVFTTILFMAIFGMLGAGNGALFQLVPLRWPLSTAVAGSMIGEIGALGGSILPNLMGFSKQSTDSYGLGFAFFAGLAIVVLAILYVAQKKWTRSWVGKGGRALPAQPATPYGEDGAMEPSLA
jgi:NNP family nitrate/nitrite transporter-like MFS transporter